MIFLDKTIFQTQIDGLSVRVIDQTTDTRHLFWGITQHSRMALGSPNQLITPYEQVMAVWQLFVKSLSANDTVLMLGLGGASAVKHTVEHNPATKIEVVELHEAVVNIAYEHFYLPKKETVTVFIDDAFAFVKQQAQIDNTAYTLLYIDLFDCKTNSTYAYQSAFFADCLALMHKDSVLVINLWSTDQAAFKKVLQAMGTVFNWRMLLLPVEGCGNVIVYAFHPDADVMSIAALKNKAQTLSQQTALPIDEYLAKIIKKNAAQLQLTMQ